MATNSVTAQAQALIVVTDNRVASQAMGIILATFPPFGFSQAAADILVAGNQASGQSNASVVKFAKQAGYGQANARNKGVVPAASQAQAKIT